ncbi:MAG: ATP-dependent nuclease [bacterium]
MIKKITINDFRLFKDKSLDFGKYLTVIAGMNSTGKSTILALLGASCELKIGKGKGTTTFRMDLSSVIMGYPPDDPTGSNKCRVDFFDNDHRLMRVAWQRRDKKQKNNEENRKRFRVIPYNKSEGGTEKKKEFPVIYLGLSRLFPIGESIDASKVTLNLNATEDKWFKDNYASILSLYGENIKTIDTVSIRDTAKKSGIGISTDKYSCLANSAGQDNLGQILYSLIRFKRLATNLSNQYLGGLLLIDEIDATLHPLAQNKLIDFLIKECRENKIQVVCTTHSTSILKHVCQKININSSNVNGDIELLYLTNANRVLEIKKNLPYTEIEAGLLIPRAPGNTYRIKIFSEDEEARWFIKNLLEDYASKIDLANVNFGWTELIRLYKADMEYFWKTAIIFDGDVNKEEIDPMVKNVTPSPKNMIILPGGNRPENILYDYLISLPSTHPYWQEAAGANLTWLHFRENPPENYGGAKDRNQYKNWFNEHLDFFNNTNLYGYWLNDNRALADEFIGNFKGVYNVIASKLLYKKLS